MSLFSTFAGGSPFLGDFKASATTGYTASFTDQTILNVTTPGLLIGLMVVVRADASG